MPVTLYPPIAILLFATNALIPQLGIITGIFSPLVLLLYMAHPQRGKHTDIMLGVLIAALGFYNHILAGFFLISPLFTAFFIRYCNRRNFYKNWMPTTGSALLSFSVIMFIIYMIPSYKEGLVQFTTNTLSMFMEAAKEVNAPMVSSPYYAQIAQDPRQSATALVMIFPAFNFIYTAAAAFISLNLFARIKRVEIERFRLPDSFVWIFISGLAIIFLNSITLRFIGLNIMIVFLTLYTFQGFEVVSFWLNKAKLLPILKAIIFVFIFSEPPIILIISLVGLFSIWFNFFGKQKEEEEKSE
jgi:hypothetical protein